jgi:hypothetical protein
MAAEEGVLNRQRGRSKVPQDLSQTGYGNRAHTFCYAMMLPGQKSGCRRFVLVSRWFLFGFCRRCATTEANTEPERKKNGIESSWKTTPSGRNHRCCAMWAPCSRAQGFPQAKTNTLCEPRINKLYMHARARPPVTWSFLRAHEPGQRHTYTHLSPMRLTKTALPRLSEVL